MKNYIDRFTAFSMNEGIFGKKKERLKSNEDKLNKFGLDGFIEHFMNGIDNPIMMNIFFRMLNTNSFTKFGQEVYSFTDEEKEKLERIKPLLDDLVNTVEKIKKIQSGK